MTDFNAPNQDRIPSMDREDLIAKSNEWKGKAVLMTTVDGTNIPGISHGQSHMHPYVTVEEPAKDGVTTLHNLSPSTIASFIKIEAEQ